MVNKLLCFLVLLVACSLNGRAYHRQAKAKRAARQPQAVKVVAQSTPKKRSPLRRFTRQNNMELRVEGIECDLCTQTVVDIVTKHGGQEVQVNDIANDYEQCYLTFVWPEKNKNIAVAQIKQELEKEGFDFLSLNGSFYGSLNEDNEQLTLTLNEDSVVAQIKQSNSNRFKRDRLMAINGMLSLVDDQYAFELI